LSSLLLYFSNYSWYKTKEKAVARREMFVSLSTFNQQFKIYCLRLGVVLIIALFGTVSAAGSCPGAQVMYKL
jgi:hypothetical protein